MRVLILLAALILSGCATGTLDISTGGPTAVVRGFDSFGPLGSRCALMAEPEYGDYLHADGMRPGAFELTIDAGETRLIAKCLFAEFVSWSGTAVLEFEAEAGQVYAVRRGDQEPRCLDLIDVSANESIITCQPFSVGRYMNLSTGEPSAFLNGGYYVHQDYARCVIYVAEQPPSALIRMDPGEITIKVQCALDGFFGGDIDGVADFTTTVLAEHEYAFSIEEDGEICLVDLVSGPLTVMCETYQRVFSSEIPWRWKP